MRKTTKSSPQAALRPQGKGDTPRRTSDGGATCFTYTLSLPDFIIITADASDGVATPSRWIHKHISEAWPDAATPLNALLKRALQTRHPAAVTLDHPAADIAMAHANCLPMMDGVGEPIHLILTLTVANQLSAADFAVAEPAKLMQIIDHLPVGVLWTDRHGRVKYANEKQCSVLNNAIDATTLPSNSHLPHPHWLKPDTHEPYRWGELPLSQTIATGASAEAVVTNGCFDDDEQVTLIKTQPIFDDAGQMVDIIAVQIDLTAQYLAEQESKRRTAEQDTIIDGMVDGLIIYDRHGKPTRYNQAVLQILGWAQADIDPLRLSEAERVAFYNAHIITSGAVRNIAWSSAQALAGDQPEPIEIAFRRPDGTSAITSVHATPLRDPVTNEITGAATVVRDITELRQIDYMKDEFMSVASHELRTPLTSLLLASRLMQRWLTRDDRTADLRRLADDVAQQVKRMDRLINNMLDLTRINTQHFAMVTQPTDIIPMIRSVIAEQQAANGRIITYSGVQASIPVEIDSERMRQVLANVLSNAIKYDSSPAPIEVTTTLCGEQAQQDTQLVIAIHDHGHGITHEQLPHLFEQGYHSLDDTTASQNLDGMRLSLYICQAIVERHGGKIWAQSVVGQGSTFYIELPASPPGNHCVEATFHMQQEMM